MPAADDLAELPDTPEYWAAVRKLAARATSFAYPDRSVICVLKVLRDDPDLARILLDLNGDPRP